MARVGAFHGKKNIYLCDYCGRGHVTLDVDEGTTPMFMKCLHCGGRCASLMYMAPQQLLAKVPPAVEWYHPSDEELATLSEATQDHVRTFGLISRELPHPIEDSASSWGGFK